MFETERSLILLSSYSLFCAVLLATLDITVCVSKYASKQYMFMDDDLMKGKHAGGSRKPRFLSFQTVDDEITVEMDLAIPFLTIPIKKTIDTTSDMMDKLYTANLNIGALGLASAMVLGSAFIIPNVLRLFSADHVTLRNGTFGRTLENGGDWISRISKELNAQGAPPRECMGRALCSLVKKSIDATSRRKSTSYDKIIDGLASNEWIQGFLTDTIFKDAIMYAYADYSCAFKFSECKLSQNAVQNFMRNFLFKFMDF